VSFHQVRSLHPPLQFGDRRPYHVSNAALAVTFVVFVIITVVLDTIFLCRCYVATLIIGYYNSIGAFLKTPQGFKGIAVTTSAVPCFHHLYWFRDVFNLDLRRFFFFIFSSIFQSRLLF
jgi:hypothetical protein